MGKLSKDISDEWSDLDILWEDEAGAGTNDFDLDILWDDTESTDTWMGDNDLWDDSDSEETETETEWEWETQEMDEEDEEEINLDELFAGLDEAAEKQAEDTENIKDSVEWVKDALNSWDNEEAVRLAEELYSQILQYESDLEAANTKYEVLKGKFNETYKKLEESNLKSEENSTTIYSEDPSMKVLNRMYDDAVKWKDTAKKKVTSLLEDMYYKVTWETIEDKQVNKSVEEQSSSTTYWNTTIPELEPKQKEEDEFDPNSILSIY